MRLIFLMVSILISGVVNSAFISPAFTGEEGEKIPKAVKEKIKKLYPDAKKIKFKHSKKKIKANFRSGEKKVNLVLEPDGKVISSVRDLFPEELPKTIKHNLNSRDTSLRKLEIEHIEEKKKSQYTIKGVTLSTSEKLKFNEEGKVLKEKVKHQKVKNLDFYDKKWELPPILLEISGISLLNDSLMACIQDELGVIYLYDLKNDRIADEIPFNLPGDYEGITLVEKDAFVLRSDGMLFRVTDFLSRKTQVDSFFFYLEKPEQDFEGLCYDKKNNRLLIVPRAFDTKDTRYKGIYSFDLKGEKFYTHPVFLLDMEDPVFGKKERKRNPEVTRPSGISIHPLTGDMYITDAQRFQILILDASGKLYDRIKLDPELFEQAEGITFTDEGIPYISNEGVVNKPNIYRIDLVRKEIPLLP